MKRKAITPAELEREYKRCLARERDRYREWAKTKQGAFETYRVLHLDAEAEEAREREHSTSWLSDRGKSAAVIRRCGAAQADILRKRKAAAIEKVRRQAPHLLGIFRLILKNGSNREKSICELVKNSHAKKIIYETVRRQYFRHRNELLALFKIGFSCH